MLYEVITIAEQDPRDAPQVLVAEVLDLDPPAPDIALDANTGLEALPQQVDDALQVRSYYFV